MHFAGTSSAEAFQLYIYIAWNLKTLSYSDKFKDRITPQVNFFLKWVQWVPHLPRKTPVDVSLCHACHVKRRWMWGCATPATQSAAASQAPKPVQARHPVPWVPRLPRKTTVDVRLCHACHAKCRGVTGAQASPSAPPSAMSATPATQNDGGCEFVPRLDVRLCHACHAKCRGVTGAQASPSAPPSAMSATPATWNEGGCEVVPRLPRKVPRRHGRPSQSKRATQCHECHACHAKRRWLWVCATPATQNDSRCEVVRRLPRKVPRRHRRPSQSKRATQCHECHACHAKRRWMWVCATPATQNDSRCEFVPRLPRETTVGVSLCHACHAKCRGVTCVCVKLLYVTFAC